MLLHAGLRVSAQQAGLIWPVEDQPVQGPVTGFKSAFGIARNLEKAGAYRLLLHLLLNPLVGAERLCRQTVFVKQIGP